MNVKKAVGWGCGTLLGIFVLLMVIGLIAGKRGDDRYLAQKAAAAASAEKVFAVKQQAKSDAEAAAPRVQVTAEPELPKAPAPKLDPLAGVSIANLRNHFERSGFRFTSDRLKDGSPRLIGEGMSKLCTIELIGGAAIERVSVLFGVVKGNVNGEATGALMHLMQQTGGMEVFRAILSAAEEQRKAIESVGGVDYDIKPVAAGMTLLTIRASK